MAPHRRSRARAREAQIAFEAISVEGGLLSPEWLARVAQLTAPQQSDADYRIPKGLNVRDEIGRYWRIAQAHWKDLDAGRKAGAEPRALAVRFVTGLLRDALGFGTLAEVAPVEVAGRNYPIGHAALGTSVPVVIAPAGEGVDTRDDAFGDANRRRSAFGLAQEYLNAAPDSLWGIATDGLVLRILRDNASLTRPAWIEADLERIFTEERYAEFAALWLLAHESRFGRDGGATSECALEAWRSAGQEQGTRARDRLRDGVEEALVALGTGFLAHPANTALHAALHGGKLTTQEYFQQLLRLVYRLIFLLAAEERGVLHPPDSDEAARTLYEQGYGIRRLRDRAVKRSAHDRFIDLWEGVKIVLRGLATAEPRLALPALGGLFAASQCPDLDASKLENRFLLQAMFKLSWIREEAGLSRVNWRDMGPEELGSVYESLLELVPRIVGGRRFEFVTGAEAKGNARKTTGSYYTPESLVQLLLDSALDPVIEATIAANPDAPVDALLKLSVVDPACGSGHFLLAAGRRLAAAVARLRSGGTPSVAEYRSALRDVVGRCLFGVDVNSMAVELCRVSLWMEAVEPGKPLSFLDSHIQQGNSLLGTTPELMAKGIPDAAWDPIEGDDKKTASALKKRNKAAAAGQRGMESYWNKSVQAEVKGVAAAVEHLDASPDVDLASLAQKEQRWGELRESAAFRHQKFVADAWCAAFVWPKPPMEGKNVPPVVEAAPTNDLWRQIRDRQGEPPALTVQTVRELAEQYQFFHWHLAFPQVLARGGFDVVLGNPPWEKLKLHEQEFFASRSEQIARAPNASARKKIIAALSHTDPVLWREWVEASRRASGQIRFSRDAGRFVLCSGGDVNTYALFAEHNLSLLAAHGRAGFVVPSGIATDDSTKELFASLVQGSRLRSLYDFQSGPGLFGEIGHARFKFCLCTVGTGAGPADLLFFARTVGDLADVERHISLTPADFETLNPNTLTCPTFRSRRDASINLTLYRRTGVFWRDRPSDVNPWDAQFVRMLDMTNDSSVFHTFTELQSRGGKRTGLGVSVSGARYVPLAEAKMVHHYNHRYGDYDDRPEGSENTSLPDVPLERLRDPLYAPAPRFWVPQSVVEARLENRWSRGWLLGWRDICRSFDERTVIAALLPRVGVGNTMPLILSPREPYEIVGLYACLCSFALDYAARQKVGGTHLNYMQIKQLPVPTPAAFSERAEWASEVSVAEWLRPRVVELTYTSWDLEPFAQDVGCNGPPFRWDPARRFLLRAELDAAFFHLYGISRDDVNYIMETFPIVRKNDEKAYGEYRTKNVILKIYDELAEAIRTGRPYQTRLDPPPADPRVAHPPRAPAAKAGERSA